MFPEQQLEAQEKALGGTEKGSKAGGSQMADDKPLTGFDRTALGTWHLRSPSGARHRCIPSQKTCASHRLHRPLLARANSRPLSRDHGNIRYRPGIQPASPGHRGLGGDARPEHRLRGPPVLHAARCSRCPQRRRLRDSRRSGVWDLGPLSRCQCSSWTC